MVLGNLQSTDKSNLYSLLVNNLSLRVLLAYSTKHKFYIHHVDECSAYLNTPINTKVYLNFPAGFNDKNGSFWLLNKSLYDLGESAHNWYKYLVSVLTSKLKFKKSDIYNCIFIKQLNSLKIIIGVYVDDLIIISSDLDLINKTKIELNNQVAISDRGTIKQFLNLELDLNLFLLSIIGRLIYLATKGRYDILHAVSQLCSFNKSTKLISEEEKLDFINFIQTQSKINHQKNDYLELLDVFECFLIRTEYKAIKPNR